MAQARSFAFGLRPIYALFSEFFLKRRAAGETLAEIAKSYAVDVSMISRLS